MLIRGPFTVEKAETACRWYYRAGFLGLPWMWGILFLFFRHYQNESETIEWYVQRAKRYALAGAVVFVAISLALLGLLPPSSPLWVIAPFQDTFQWGIFATNFSAHNSSAASESSSGSVPLS